MHPYLFTLPGGTVVPTWGVIISLTVVGTILVGHSVGELGLGTNPNAPREQLGSISEKAIGTAHLGIGSNDFLGGTTSEGIHIDLIVEDPSMWLDGQPVELSDIGQLR